MRKSLLCVNESTMALVRSLATKNEVTMGKLAEALIEAAVTAKLPVVVKKSKVEIVSTRKEVLVPVRL